MNLFRAFHGKGVLKGEVRIENLPENKMYSVSLSLFRVSGPEAPTPYGGDPPGDAYTDEIGIKEAEEPKDSKLTFEVRRPRGYYHVDVGVIAFIEREGKIYAQVEHFFPLSKPCHIRSGSVENVKLNVTWPAIPFEDLGYYGSIHPRKKYPDA